MTTSDDSEKLVSCAESDVENMLSIEVSGRDAEVWDRREKRFLQRLGNSVKKLFGADIPSHATANPELQDAADTLVQSAHEALKTPQLVNLERQASIKLKMAEANEKEANARKLNAEAEKMELELNREKVLQSQRIIDRLIQRGELLPVEKDGQIYFIFKTRNLGSDS